MNEDHREFLQEVLWQAKKLGAEYTDCRLYPEDIIEEIKVENGEISALNFVMSAGFGVRVLAQGNWGFFATPILDRKKILKIVQRAVHSANQNAKLQKHKVALAPHRQILSQNEVVLYQTSIHIDPFSIPIEQKLVLLASADEAMKQASKKVFWRISEITTAKTRKLFASSDGIFADQTIIESGATVRAYAKTQDGSDIQIRSYPDSHFCPSQGGYEMIQRLDLVRNAAKIALEAEQLLSARQASPGERGVILLPSMLNLHGHETTHGFEADRVMGTEWTLSGGSFLTPLLPQIGEFKFGSDNINLTADSTIEHGVGTFSVDDEGTPSQRTPLVERGIWKGLLTSRQTILELNNLIGKNYFAHSSGAVRADGYGNWPMIRMTNIILEPGETDFEDLKESVPNGTVMMGTNKSWSIDDVRRHFNFAMEIAWEKVSNVWEIRKNATYYGDNLNFWRNCQTICDKKSFELKGTGNCGKADPLQTMRTGHGSSPAYFTNIQVGSVG